MQPVDRQRRAGNRVPHDGDDVGPSGHANERTGDLRRAPELREYGHRSAGLFIPVGVPHREPRIEAHGKDVPVREARTRSVVVRASALHGRRLCGQGGSGREQDGEEPK
jgi:hypothetical protein